MQVFRQQSQPTTANLGDLWIKDGETREVRICESVDPSVVFSDDIVGGGGGTDLDGDVEIGGSLTVGGEGTGVVALIEGEEPDPSAEGEAVIYADETDHQLKVSQNEGAYSPLLTVEELQSCSVSLWNSQDQLNPASGILLWDTALIPNPAMWEGVTHPGRVTIPKSGWYVFTTSLKITFETQTDDIWVGFSINGNDPLLGINSYVGDRYTSQCLVHYCTAGDYVEVRYSPPGSGDDVTFNTHGDGSHEVSAIFKVARVS